MARPRRKRSTPQAQQKQLFSQYYNLKLFPTLPVCRSHELITLWKSNPRNYDNHILSNSSSKLWANTLYLDSSIWHSRDPIVRFCTNLRISISGHAPAVVHYSNRTPVMHPFINVLGFHRPLFWLCHIHHLFFLHCLFRLFQQLPKLLTKLKHNWYILTPFPFVRLFLYAQASSKTFMHRSALSTL